MGIYLCAFFTLVVAKISNVVNNAKNNKKFICIFWGLIYFLIAALRGRNIGGDTDIYVNSFYIVSSLPYKEAAQYIGRDPFFYVFISFVGKIWCNYTFLFSIVAFLFTSAITYFIYKYSDDPFLSWIIMLAFNLYQFSLTAMRQTIAISFIIFASSFLIEKKFFRGLIFVFIASLFHKTALCFLLVFIFYKVKISKTFLYFSFVLLGITYSFRSQIAEIFFQFFNEDGREFFVENRNAGFTMLLVIAAIYVFCVIFVKKEWLKESEIAQKMFVLSFFALIFETLVPSQSIFFRLAFYFLFGFTALLPNMINNCIIDSKKTVYAIFFVVLSIQYLFFTIGSCYITPYCTFWQAS